MTDDDYIFKVHDRLFLGGYWPGLNFEKINDLGITAIVNLMEENLYDPRPQFAYLFKGFPDDWYPPHSHVEDILVFIDKHVKDGNVLVHCARGVSRSGGLIIAWLLKQHPNWKWNDALEHVCKSRLVFPANEIKESILDYFESIEKHRRE